MFASQAKLSIKNLYSESFSLTPSALITLFEFDISDIAFDRGLIASITDQNEGSRIYRFHNNVPLITSNIVWQNKTFLAAPIRAEGFDLNGRGTLPTPRLSITVSSEDIPLMAQLKSQIASLGDLAGVKVTRIRTFAKFLDAINFVDNFNPNADINSEFPREIFYVDRRSLEDKTTMELELASLLDIEGIKLPARIVVANRCTWQYRGEGCLYEAYNPGGGGARPPLFDIVSLNTNLPTAAPPVATEQDTELSTLLPANIALVPKGKWDARNNYAVGEYVFVEKNSIRYYFVARIAVPQNVPPPNGSYWLADACSKQIRGCKLRWGIDSDRNLAPGRANGNPHRSCLPFGGFPASSKLR